MFAGAGGLSEGLRQSGAATTRWAVESCPQAAASFADNHPQAKVICEESSLILEELLLGLDQRNLHQGEVDLVSGGLPCQGFSRMNRFRHSGKFSRKNDLVGNLLSFVDWLRPRFFLMENVHNFLLFRRCEMVRWCGGQHHTAGAVLASHIRSL